MLSYEGKKDALLSLSESYKRKSDTRPIHINKEKITNEYNNLISNHPKVNKADLETEFKETYYEPAFISTPTKEALESVKMLSQKFFMASGFGKEWMKDSGSPGSTHKMKLLVIKSLKWNLQMIEKYFQSHQDKKNNQSEYDDIFFTSYDVYLFHMFNCVMEMLYQSGNLQDLYDYYKYHFVGPYKE